MRRIFFNIATSEWNFAETVDALNAVFFLPACII